MADDVDAPPGGIERRPPPRGKLARLWGPTARNSLLSVLDQGLVSIGNFVTSVLLGRLAGLEELGAYTLGFTMLIVAATAHEALVAIPYTVFGNRLDDDARRSLAGSTFVHAIALAVVLAVALAVAALVVLLIGGPGDVARILFVVAAVVVVTVVREFARRHAFAELRVSTAVAIDGIATAVQLGGIAFLAAIDALTAPAVVAVIGVAAAATGLAWYRRNRSGLVIRRSEVFHSLERHWEFGRWVGAARLTSIAHSYIVPWLLAVLIGITATGGYSAAATVVAVTNPLLIGVGMVLTPRAAQAYHAGGFDEVRRVALKATLALTIVAGAIALPLVWFGEEILRVVYGGAADEFGAIVAVLSIALVVSVLGMGAEAGLRVIERPRVSFVASGCGLVTTATLTLLVAPAAGAVGGAWGVLAGGSVSAAIRCGAFFGGR